MSYASIAELRDYLDQLPNYGQQLITVTGSPTGGTFTLLYEGVATGAIAYNATATALKTALQAHASISTNVKVTGPPGAWLAQFQGVLATDAGPLSLGTNSLTGGTSPSVLIVPSLDAKFQKVLDRASRIIDTYLGYSLPALATDEQIVYGDGTDYLTLPPFAVGSITEITAPAGYTVPDYIEVDGVLIVTRSDIVGTLYGSEALAGRLYRPEGGWLAGVPYTVAATFGTTRQDDLVEACLEIAVDLWRFKDAGSIKSVGVEGAGVVTGKGLPTTAREILDARRARASFPGVW